MERAALRAAREATTAYRAAVREAVGDYVRRMRDAGVAPENALVTVKRRLTLTVSTLNPCAPTGDAAQLEADASAWAIRAYFDAA